MAYVSAQLCQEHESLIRWLQSWVAGNQEAGAPVNWGQVSISKGAASPRAHLGAGPCRAKLDTVVALTGHCEQFREEPELEKILGSFSQLPWTCISESIQSWKNHQELSSMPRPWIAHNAQSKPPQYPVLLCRAPLQGEHGEKQLLWRWIPAPN